MKNIKAVLLSAILLAIASKCSAQLYQADFSATLSTQVVSGSTYSITTVHLTNASLAKEIADLYPVQAKNVAIVFDPGTLTLEAINTGSNDIVVDTLMAPGGDNVINNIGRSMNKNLILFGSDTDLQFTIPNYGAVIDTTATISTNQNKNGYTSFLVSFLALSGTYTTNGTVEFQGTIKKGTKVYSPPAL